MLLLSAAKSYDGPSIGLTMDVDLYSRHEDVTGVVSFRLVRIIVSTTGGEVRPPQAGLFGAISASGFRRTIATFVDDETSYNSHMQGGNMKALVFLLAFHLVTVSVAICQTSTLRTVCLENFTGTWCGYEPHETDTINTILAAIPNMCVLSYHGGSTGEPFQTTEGNAFILGINQTQWPMATTDRVLWSGQPKIPISRAILRAACSQRAAAPSPLSLSLTGSYHETSRLLTVNIHMHALQQMLGEYRLNVVISEDSVNYPQTYFSGSGPVLQLDPYYHMNLVRKMVTGATGWLLTATRLAQNWTHDTTVTYALPSAWAERRIKVTAFVSGMNGSAFGEIVQATQKSIYSVNSGFLITPVALLSFTSAQSQAGVALHWSTGLEVNNCGWDIEKRGEEASWRTIGFVGGSGTTFGRREYGFSDPDVRMGWTYSYRLRQRDFSGDEELSPVSTVTTIAIPTTKRLSRNYPNPFKSSTEITFDISFSTVVRLDIFDAMGRHVRTLADGSLEAGSYEYEWDGRSHAGIPLASGIYVARLSTPTSVHAVLMQLAR
jgi:hypothetical protein